eukprot:m.706825 g.706825  ORF g.706825 m.706825 type:complete len:106 (-) comp22935_c0_seq1:4127-4444(-)
MLVTLGPSTTFPFIGGDNPRFPFHLWDFMCATQTWDYFSLGRYRPQARDLELGARIRSMWLDLSTQGYGESDFCLASNGCMMNEIPFGVMCVSELRVSMRCSCDL